MSLPNNIRSRSNLQRALPLNNNQVNSFMFNFGTCYSKFDAANDIKAFGWELTGHEIQKIRKGATSPRAKEIELGTEALFHGNFAMKMMANGDAKIQASIKGEREAKKAPLMIEYCYVKNGIHKVWSDTIERAVFDEIVQQRGRLEVVAQFVEAPADPAPSV